MVGTVLRARQSVLVEAALVDAFELAVGVKPTTSAVAPDGAEVRRAPPTFVYHLVHRPFDVTRDQRPGPLVDLPLGSPVNGGVEFDFARPVLVGEVLSAETVLHSVEPRRGSRGSLAVVITRTSVCDAAGDEVACYRHTTLYRRHDND